ncbi:MAG: hypothetical protein ABSE49_04080 [Polyangiaceae bacterium]|jgi:hypothetical protein
MGTLQLVEDLSPGLRPVYESIRELLAGATRDEARSRHRIGVHIVEVKLAADKYGTRAVERLALALGTNVHTLYRCASVAECWSTEQLDEVLRRTTAKGQPLSWSHLVLLAGVTPARGRGDLTDLALRKQLTVRELVVHLEARRRWAVDKRATVVLQRLVKATERWSEAARGMHDELLAELEEADREDETESAGLLEQAILAEEQLHRVVVKQLARLRAERARLTRRAGKVDLRAAKPLMVAGVRGR